MVNLEMRDLLGRNVSLGWIGIILVMVLAMPATVGAAETSAANPNILIFVADDLGWGDSRVFNPDSMIAMPNLERLAAEGMRFMDAHTASAKCAPSRYTIVTGNYSWRGLKEYGQWVYKGGSQILSSQWTLGDVLQRHGYNTAIVGKWHLGGDFYRIGSDEFVSGREPENVVDFSRRIVGGPLDHGFNYSFLALSGIQGSPYAYFENDQLVGDPGELFTWTAGRYGDSIIKFDGIGMPYWDTSQAGPELARSAVAFIDRHHQTNVAQGTDTPFFLYYNSQSAHTPYTPPDTFMGEPVEGITGMSPRADMKYEIDVALGHLLAALEQRGIAENTLVIFTSDNGGLRSEIEIRRFGHDAVGGLRGLKGQIWEGGHRVPMVAKWGDGSPAGSVIPPNTTSNQMIGAHDLMATVAAVVGEQVPADQALDSFNFLPVFLGKRGDDEPVRDHIIMQADVIDDGVSLQSGALHYGYREGSWKLVFDGDQNVMGLYNLATDLAETSDLKDDPTQAERITRMESNFLRLRAANRTAPEPAPEPVPEPAQAADEPITSEATANNTAATNTDKANEPDTPDEPITAEATITPNQPVTIDTGGASGALGSVWLFALLMFGIFRKKLS